MPQKHQLSSQDWGPFFYGSLQQLNLSHQTTLISAPRCAAARAAGPQDLWRSENPGGLRKRKGRTKVSEVRSLFHGIIIKNNIIGHNIYTYIHILYLIYLIFSSVDQRNMFSLPGDLLYSTNWSSSGRLTIAKPLSAGEHLSGGRRTKNAKNRTLLLWRTRRILHHLHLGRS